MYKDTAEPIERRISALRNKLQASGLEGILIGSSTNRRWLSGFNGSAGWLLISPEKAILATDFRYWEQAQSQAPVYDLFRIKGLRTEFWSDFLELAQASRIGIESNYITLAQFERLEGLDAYEWEPVEDYVEQLRSIKSDSEIAAIREAAAITDLAMHQVNELAQPGMSEIELAWTLEKLMRDSGASGMAFPIIVASGPNGARAHHEPGDRILKEGDTVVIDMGAELNGYNSDLTRSFYIGAWPSDRFEQVYDVVLKAQTAALQRIRSGLSGKEIDSLARDVIKEAGFGNDFGHSLGHGIGLDVHEEPRLSQFAENGIIPAGAVVTVEPGIYLNNWGGIRIEDLVLVHDSRIEILSQCPKNPIIV
jgi:Xaa-Pro aminopeptidase